MKHLLIGLRLVFAALAMTALPQAWAHKASDAYASVAQAANGPVQVRLSVALKDIDAAQDTLDADNDRRLTWGEVRQALPGIALWLGEGAAFRCGAQPLRAEWRFESLETRVDGSYARFAAAPACDAQRALALDYRLMRGIDPTHRLIVAGSLGGQPLAAVLSPQGADALVLRAGEGAPAGAAQALPQTGPAVLAHFFPEGIHHIATGYDHLAFLLALLLPIALRRQGAADQPSRPGLLALLTTVTGFTVGHSVTLVLATLGWISSPAWVEPAIAVTIALAAFLNLHPQPWIRGDVLALGFGLIHGLGFSNVMREAGVDGPLLPWALAGFNLGVEAGQLVGVALWCGVHLALASWPWYDKVVVRGGSWALLLLALVWAAQRVFPSLAW